MDRRRFFPAPEGLEGRALMSTTAQGSGVSSLFGQPSSLKSESQDVPATISLKIQRIDRLPYYLNQLQPGRVLPQPIVSEIQTGLTEAMAVLAPVPSAVLTDFNHQLRDTLPRQTLSAGDARGLSHYLQVSLVKAAASPTAVGTLQDGLNQLAKVDANSPNSVYLVTNDYSTILETALAVGHPIQRPDQPALSFSDGLQVTNGGVTANPTPKLVGTYKPASESTVEAGIQMQIVDQAGNVLGVGEVQPNGKWGVYISTPLSPGKHVVHARAYESGYVSDLSEAFILKVVAKPTATSVQENITPPGGPLGMK